MKRILSMLLVLLMLLSTAVAAGVTVTAEDHTVSDDVILPDTSVYSGTPDYSWYLDEQGTVKSGTGENGAYVLKSADQFIAFRNLTNGVAVNEVEIDPQNFVGKTVLLDCNVVINEGYAPDWWAATNFVGATTDYVTTLKDYWSPIGARYYESKFDFTNNVATINDNIYFGGIFDGQNHYISGIYSLKQRSNGLFCQLTGATVKNFAIVNSVFYNYGIINNSTPGASNQHAGSVAARMKDSTISGVYSDAYVYSGFAAGGIVGNLESGRNTIFNTVFAGTMDASANNKYMAGGFAGCDLGTESYFENCAAIGTYVMGVHIRTGQSSGQKTDSYGHGGFMGIMKNTSMKDCVIATTYNIEGARSRDGYSSVGYMSYYKNEVATITNVVSDKEKASTTSQFMGYSASNSPKVILTNVQNMTTAQIAALQWDGWTHTAEGYMPTVVYENLYKNIPDFCATAGYYGTPDYSWYVASASESGITKVEKTNGAYVIDSAADLYGFAFLSNGLAVVNGITVAPQSFEGEKLVLGADINVNAGDYESWDSEAVVPWIPVGHEHTWGKGARYFAGELDGQGYSISGIYVDGDWAKAASKLGVSTSSTWYTGFAKNNQGVMSSFISHAVSAKIHDLAIVNSVIRVQDGSSGDSTAIAALIDKVDAGTQISNIYTNAYIRGRMASGGIAGMVRNGTAGTIDGCIFNGVLAVNAIGTRTDYSAGGIVGQFESNSGSCYTVSNCLNMGVLDLSDTTVSVYVGGIVGGKSNGIGNLSNCISAMTVVDTKETKTALGMISGTASTGVKASNCVYDAAKAPTGTYAVKGATSNASGFTSVANLADLDVSAWSAWTHLTADIPVPTAAWNLAERTFDDVALSFVQETDVSTIDKGDSLYTGYTVRLVAEVYDLDADVAGFEVWNGNTYVELGHSTTVYKSLNAKGEDGEIGQVKADYGKYFTAIEINVASGMVQTFTVRPYTVIEGQYVYGAAYTITYNAQGQFVSAVLAK